MAIKSTKISISFDAPAAGLLTSLAKQEHMSIESFIKELVLAEIERREDETLCKLVHEREAKNEPRISHENAWK